MPVKMTVAGLGGELVTNGEFEVNANGWTPLNATLTGGSANPFSGVGCLEVAESGVSTYGYAVELIEAMTIGKRYKLSAYFKNGTADTGKIYVGTASGGSQIYNSGGTTDVSWTEYTYEFVTPQTFVYVSLWSIGDNDTAYYDKVSLREVPARVKIADAVKTTIGA